MASGPATLAPRPDQRILNQGPVWPVSSSFDAAADMREKNDAPFLSLRSANASAAEPLVPLLVKKSCPAPWLP